jgi:Ca2+-binding RTX toxin-like protein
MAFVVGTDNSELINIPDGVTFQNDIILGLGGHDTIQGAPGEDLILGGDGNDALEGGEGADDLHGGDGSDWAVYNNSAWGVTVSLATGSGWFGDAEDDVLVSIENLRGSAHADDLFGNNGDNSFDGNEGDDTILGEGGNDTLQGGLGADHLHGGLGIDMASYKDASAAVLVNLTSGAGYGGEALGDTLIWIEDVYGSNYGDGLFGNDAANALWGGGGADLLQGKGGADRLNGGPGFDTAFYDSSPEGVFVSLFTGHTDGGHAEGDVLGSIENLYGSAHADTLWGDNGVNEINGGGGDDSLKGFGGADTLNGNTGYDTVSYEESPEGVFVSLFSGHTDGGTAEGDVLINIENLTGTAYADDLWGDDNINVLKGMNGNDTLKGIGGADTLLGGLGNDDLEGGDGNDTLNGGAGVDDLYGGGHADTFVWTSTGDTSTANANADVIWDFAEGDRLDVGAIDADVYASGNQAFTFIGTSAFSGTPGEINYVHSGGDTYIQLQVGTSADVEAVIRLDGLHTPQASWFIL